MSKLKKIRAEKDWTPSGIEAVYIDHVLQGIDCEIEVTDEQAKQLRDAYDMDEED